LQVDRAIETGCETVSDADSGTSIGGYREAAAVLDAERTVCGSGATSDGVASFICPRTSSFRAFVRPPIIDHF